ncbi:Oligomycin resistance ATP-dependent permease [Wickerhamomyces ciferrii]|uniref:Oligomycin resistance ATP-dependent permease n=1 Tax=Wickerhamomyces ciferrii (strain ATCC 14091 / BCRC 22168 / CBS 111 / JCM 3599 / NBRC 0793 / NRRL Y-1031 F-60-10) TaxID=1206466 RepID=K0KT90_WICCF|nr:Oligomycin resistance ATP-dependent permease [Wickerhamomyces ciferrii]CCH46371.1 Oligomycin resistance ATP-dependent permease [Wickerhamomyces ciferrii]
MVDVEQQTVYPEGYNKDDMILQKRLMTPLLSKKVPQIPNQDERKRYPYMHSNYISRIFFWWIIPLLNIGYKRTLTSNDLYKLEDDMSINHTYPIFESHLNKIVAKSRSKALKKNPNLTEEELENIPYPKYSLVKALFLTFKVKYSLAIIFKALADIAQTLNPLLTKALINYVEERVYKPSTPLGKGIGYAFGVAFVLLANGILINHFLHNSLTTGAHCKAILTTALLKKSFNADAKTRHTYNAGKVTSLMGTDLARIDLAVGFQPFAITFPLPVIIAIVLLIVNIGVSALAGIAIFIISIAIIGASAKRLLLMRKSANQYTDKRIGFMREILQSMKIIKFYSWEDAYQKNVTEQRNKEVSIIFKMQTIRNFLMAYSVTLPTFTSMVAFLVLYGVKNDRNPANIFSSLSLFSALANQVLMLPMALATGADAMIGIGRVREYLQCPDGKPLENNEDFDNNDGSQMINEKLAIKVKNASFEWEEFPEVEEIKPIGKEKKGLRSRFQKKKKVDELDEKSNVILETSTSTDQSLKTNDQEINSDPETTAAYTKNVFKGFHDINFEIKKGEFIIVTGPIGSGKSSLLTALSGFMKKTQGNLGINGSLLLCGQSWVQNATVRENILFGLEFDEVRYRQVLKVCALTDDLKSFTGGELTEIGERGITLSGGQKARINLARAVYANKDVLLLDDVLSAVDARVGKHIMDNCLVDYLHGKTRILATHQLSLVNDADRIIYLNGDGTINMGTVDELLATTPGFVTLMEYSKKSQDEENSEDDDDGKPEVIGEADVTLQATKSNTVSEKAGNAETGALIKAEEKAVNQTSWKVYLTYLKAGNGIFGIFASPLAILSLVIEVFCGLFVNVWLSFWIEYKFKTRSDGFYIGIYVMFVFLYTGFSSCTFVLMGYITIFAAKVLNLRAMQKILHAPMSYIDTTPIGRIMNRFTKDTDALDNETGEQIRLFLHPTFSVGGILIMCIIYLPWFAIAIPPLGVVFVCVTNYYQSSSREIKRLEAVKRSFVYNNFNEVLGGMNTIKAYNASDRFILKNSELLDNMNEAYFLVIANQRWISIHLDAVACVLSLIVSLLSVSRQFNISPASAGLVVTYTLNMAGLLSLILRAYTQVENEMNSVERLCHYANDLDQENAYRKPETQPSSNWPEFGSLKFQNVSLRYRDGLPLVLKNLNVNIKGGEKIGICGRTGAGKSSIMTALYRLSELAEGDIIIDDINIKQLGLYELRSKLSIIPQDPVLFQGSIRKNLDPFDEHDEDKLWDALRRSGLIEDEQVLEVIKKQDKLDENFHKFHLNQQVEDEGANFSLGERQLLALARALVRDSKILILDEATSSVDYETDAKIQTTIANEFKDCTILCIAHRLKTILGYDRILVLEQGEIEQFDEPVTLFNEVDGIFRQMCDRSDIKSSDFLKDSYVYNSS